MIIPPYLKQGDKVALVAPARKITPAELGPAIQIIGQWGFEPVLAPYVYREHNQFGGTDAERLADMQWALDDVNIKALVVARGGYGCLRLVDGMEWHRFASAPKWIVGYSDVTVFHSAAMVKTNVCALHATMAFKFTENKEATQSLYNAITGKGNTYVFKGEHARSKNVEGIIVGGNLSLLYALLGSKTDVDTNGKILFIEDLDEYLYHVDRMMLAMKRAGKLDGLKALVVGGMTDMKDHAIPFGKNAHEIILDAVKEYNYPVFFNFPAGHQPQNNAIVLGAECTIEINGDEVKFWQ